jgi:hypothetical protein
MMQRRLAVYGFAWLVCVTVSVLPAPTQAVFLDKDGEMKLGVRTYVNARVGTEDTNKSEKYDTSGARPTGERLLASQTFPFSSAGHLRQNRFFIEAEFHHELKRLQKEGFGPLEVLNHLPFRVRNLAYHLTFRGEADGLYDWGPREYSTADQYTVGESGPCPVLGAPPGTPCVPLVDLPDSPIFNPVTGAPNRADVFGARQRLRKLGTDRERLFQAYVEASVGDLYFRLGRQVWSWGETDGFRLLDQINPIDSSFGGFLISLDERRVPLDMLRAEYRLGSYGPFSEIALHGFGAVDDKVGYNPGTPSGSPWTLPNLGAPSSTTLTKRKHPRRSFRDIRGGGRLAWNMFDATFSLAHYYTYFDTPSLVVYSPQLDTRGELPQFPFPAGVFADGFSAHAIQDAPVVQVSGASTTFALPQFYTIVRSEFAYFNGEPRFRQRDLDPFIFALSPGLSRNAQDPLTGANAQVGRNAPDTGSSINYVLGLDINQYVRFLNPYQTFFFSTQFFYKHLVDAAPNRCDATFPNKVGCDPTGKYFASAPGVLDGEVLPVPEANVQNPTLNRTLNRLFGALEPRFIRQQTNQFLQTLFITTSYRSGTINPSVTLFYDWSGALVYLPSITFLRDPWRFTMSYSILDAGTLKGNSGVSLLKDRDNVLFQFEYSI